MKLHSRHTITIFLCIILLLTCLGLKAQVVEDNDKKKDKHWILNLIYDDETGDVKRERRGEPKELTRKINLSKLWHFSIGDNDDWVSPAYDDHHWEEIRVPSGWENEGFHGYDGYAWYRTEFDGRLLDKGQTHYLMPGIIDDVDETFINGQLVGKSGSFPPKHRTAFTWNREYQIPNRVINFAGKNVISIRVYDHLGKGGIVGGEPGIYSSVSNENLLQDLYGEWKFINRDISAASRIDFNDSKWNEILVPARWENQGYRSHNGIAWYRKHFHLTFIPDEEKVYYLLLGKIDDFDVTYLNGKKIGATFNKTDSWKTSRTWEIIRVYKIPAGLLRANGDNVIALKVKDVGGLGGIYQGPIGLIDEKNLTRTIRK